MPGSATPGWSSSATTGTATAPATGPPDPPSGTGSPRFNGSPRTPPPPSAKATRSWWPAPRPSPTTPTATATPERVGRSSPTTSACPWPSPPPMSTATPSPSTPPPTLPGPEPRWNPGTVEMKDEDPMPPKRTDVTLADVASSTGLGPTFQDGGHRAGGILDAITASEPKATTVIAAALRHVAPHPDNPRSQLGDLTDMAETITAGGLIQPLVVMTAAAWRAANPDRAGDIDPDARWVILAGHRRWAAAELAGSHDVPVLVRDDLGVGSAANVTFLVENIHRQNLAPLDEATALSRLAAHNLSQREIARLTGISQAQVSKKLSLLTLPDAAKADMRCGELTFTEALRLLELPDHLQAGVYEQGKQHGYTLDAAIRITTARLDTEAKAAAARQRLADEGTGLIEDPAEEFGSDQVHLHHLWDENDITAAKTAGICVAHIETHGRVEFYATTPKPWPWQPPAPRTGNRSVPQPRPDDPDTADN